MVRMAMSLPRLDIFFYLYSNPQNETFIADDFMDKKAIFLKKG